MSADELDAQRQALADLDGRILALIAERQERSLEIGRLKAGLGRGTRDFTREKVVVRAARDRAVRLGLDADLAQRLVELLIDASLSVQEQDRVTTADTGSGRRALIHGGAGRMGRWFATLLTAQGWQPVVIDPAGPVPGLADAPSLEAAAPGPDDLILLATPPAVTARTLAAFADRPPPCVVLDISSVKAPLRPALDQLLAAGGRVASLHPMFGPETSRLSGRRLLRCEPAHPDAIALVDALLAPTLATCIPVPLDDHDRLVATVLSSAHAVSLLFAHALADSGVDVDVLRSLGSTTFDAQAAVSGDAVHEDPAVLREIHAANPHGTATLDRLADALDAVRHAATEPARFEAVLRRAARYLGAEGPPTSGQG